MEIGRKRGESEGERGMEDKNKINTLTNVRRFINDKK